MAHKERNMEHTVELQFDGQSVPMVPFVKELIINVVLGMAKTMHGYREDTEVRLVIKKEQ